jgi:glycosyltransferase involved in cell wall biosynthesis
MPSETGSTDGPSNVARCHHDRVEVLLATYNGAAHLPDLIGSLAGQTHPNVGVLARDDGSEDATPALLGAAKRRQTARILRAQRAGYPGCFFDLVDHADPEASYFAFADQDDVWLPHKLARAVAWLNDRRDSRLPTLYCSRVQLTDPDLVVRGLSPVPGLGPSFANALVQNICIGCTTVVNRAGLDLLRSVQADGALRHDWWAYLMFTAFGEVRYDICPSVLYRQHSTNALGAGATATSRLHRRLARYLRAEARREVIDQLSAFRDAAGPSLDPARARLLDRYLDDRGSPIRRLGFALTGPVSAQRRIDGVGWRLMYALGLV